METRGCEDRREAFSDRTKTPRTPFFILFFIKYQVSDVGFYLKISNHVMICEKRAT